MLQDWYEFGGCIIREVSGLEKALLMAVDLGTSFIKCGLYDTLGRCAAEAMESVKDERPGPGIFIQKGEDLFASVLACMKQVCRQIENSEWSVEAIAFTGQMSGFMGIDKNWNDITTWSCSLDSRYMPYARKQMELHKDEFLKTGGTNFPQMAPKYVWFKEEFPEESRKIEKYLMISGYVIGRLGKLDIDQAVMDISYASWTGLADMHKGIWSEEICDSIGLERKNLPRMVQSDCICGSLSEEYAKQIGLKSGIPLVAGAGDKVAGCLGAAVVEPGDAIFEASSYGEISCCVEEYRPDMKERRLDVLAAAIPGLYYATHFAAGSGITLDWAVNTFIKSPEETLKDAFIRADRMAADVVPGCGGMMAVGLLGGSSMPLDGNLKGIFMGFDWSHHAGHFYRALLESFSFDFSLALERVRDLYPEYTWNRMKMTGGGAKSTLWPQICADITGVTHTILDRNDVSMWGASILAGHAVGIFRDMKQTAKQFVKKRMDFEAVHPMDEAYVKQKQIYREYTEIMGGFCKKLSA